MNLLRILVISSVFASISFAGSAEGSSCCLAKKEAAPATCSASAECPASVCEGMSAEECAKKCAAKSAKEKVDTAKCCPGDLDKKPEKTKRKNVRNQL